MNLEVEVTFGKKQRSGEVLMNPDIDYENGLKLEAYQSQWIKLSSLEKYLYDRTETGNELLLSNECFFLIGQFPEPAASHS